MNTQIKLAMDAAKVREAAADPAKAAQIIRALDAAGFWRAMPGTGARGLLKVPASEITVDFKDDGTWACDAQPELALQPNAGIPAWLVNYMDPEIVHILNQNDFHCFLFVHLCPNRAGGLTVSPVAGRLG